MTNNTDKLDKYKIDKEKILENEKDKKHDIHFLPKDEEEDKE